MSFRTTSIILCLVNVIFLILNTAIILSGNGETLNYAAVVFGSIAIVAIFATNVALEDKK